MIYCNNYKIGFEDIGKNNEATNRALIEIMQDIACLHGADVGHGVLEVENSKKAWMLLDWKIKVIRRPKYNEEILTQTWSRKMQRIYAYRDFILKDKEGNLVAIGTSRWIFVDIERRRPTRLTEDIMNLYEPELDKMVFDEEIEDIKYENYLFKKDYTVLRRDIDINNHMHNLNYLDMAYDILPEEVYKDKVFDNVRIVYKKEILYGEKVECFYTEEDGKYIVTAKTDGKVNAIIELS